MPRTVVTVVTAVLLSLAVAGAGQALDFSGLAYFGALLVIGLLASLTDLERFGWR